MTSRQIIQARRRSRTPKISLRMSPTQLLFRYVHIIELSLSHSFTKRRWSIERRRAGGRAGERASERSGDGGRSRRLLPPACTFAADPLIHPVVQQDVVPGATALAQNITQQGKKHPPALLQKQYSRKHAELCQSRAGILLKKKYSSCDIEDFVETHICKQCVLLRSRVLLGVRPR